MTVKYNVKGDKRKALVLCISEWFDITAEYKGAPTFDYQVGDFTISKDGELSYPSGLDEDMVERLLEHLYDEGYDAEGLPDDGFSVAFPADYLDEPTIANVGQILANKGDLIQKALGADNIDIVVEDDKVSFPWFTHGLQAAEMRAITDFLSMLVKMAKSQKRVNIKDWQADNEKYAFRCFLLRLGFIGDEYKQQRKILLSKLEGSSAFKAKKVKEEV